MKLHELVRLVDALKSPEINRQTKGPKGYHKWLCCNIKRKETPHDPR